MSTVVWLPDIAKVILNSLTMTSSGLAENSPYPLLTSEIAENLVISGKNTQNYVELFVKITIFASFLGANLQQVKIKTSYATIKLCFK